MLLAEYHKLDLLLESIHHHELVDVLAHVVLDDRYSALH